MMTHHHFDHVLGVSAYEDEGATVIAAAAHERIMRRAANDTEGLDIRLVEEQMTFETEDRRLEVIDIGPTAHTEHLLVAYLPDEGILFEADHFTLPQAGPIPPAVSSTKTFAAAVAKHGLEVTKFVTAHSYRVATPDDLKAALEAEIFSCTLDITGPCGAPVLLHLDNRDRYTAS